MTRFSRSVASFLCLCAAVAESLTVGAGKASATSPGPLVYAVNPYDNDDLDGRRGFQPFDAFTGQNIGGAKITIDTINSVVPVSSVDAAAGIAIDPIGGTAFVLLKGEFGDQQLPRVLATLNLTNGVATTIGNTTFPLTNITWANGVLYGVGAGGANESNASKRGHLFTVNTSNASLTDVATLTNCPGNLDQSSNCGHAIVYNSDDGNLYHMSGEYYDNGQSVVDHQVFERVVLPGFTKQPLTWAPGPRPDMVLGMGWDAAADRFIITDWNGDAFSVTVNGSDVAAGFPLPETVQYMKGLVVSPDPVPTDTPPTAVDDNATVTESSHNTFIDIFGNDTDPDGGPQSVVSIGQPAHGTTGSGYPNGAYYSPDPGYCNDGAPTDDFTYTLNGGSTGTVHVTVTCDPFVGPLVFGVDPSGNSTFPGSGGLRGIDVGNGNVEFESFLTVTFGSPITGNVTDGHALAANPRTGVVYALLNLDTVNDRVLATVDPLTGDVTTIGNTHHNSLVSMTFDSNGTLYAATDSNDNPCPNCLLVLNPSTAASRKIKTISEDSGQAIAFNPRDNKIYHWSSSTFETIDPRHSFAVRNIGFGGLVPNSSGAMGFNQASSAFILFDDSDEAWRVASNGGAIQLPDLDQFLDGLVVATPALSLKYASRRRLFSGRLMTPALSDCDGTRTVSIFRDVSTGPDVLMGTAVTDATGAFSHRVGARRGRYYATVTAGPPLSASPDSDLPCPDGMSNTFVVR